MNNVSGLWGTGLSPGTWTWDSGPKTWVGGVGSGPAGLHLKDVLEGGGEVGVGYLLLLGIEWPCEGRSLQGQQGPRCQSIRTQKIQDVVSTGSGSPSGWVCPPGPLGGQATVGRPRSELHRRDLHPEVTWAPDASGIKPAAPAEVCGLEARGLFRLEEGAGRGHG